MKAYLFRAPQELKVDGEAEEAIYVPGKCLIKYGVRGNYRNLEQVEDVRYSEGTFRMCKESLKAKGGKASLKGLVPEEVGISEEWVDKIIRLYKEKREINSEFSRVSRGAIDATIVDSIDSRVSVICPVDKKNKIYNEIVYDVIDDDDFEMENDPERGRWRIRASGEGEPVCGGADVGFFDRRDCCFKAFKETKFEEVLRQYKERRRELVESAEAERR